MPNVEQKTMKSKAKGIGHWLWKEVFLDHIKGWVLAALASIFTWKLWDNFVAWGSGRYSATGWQILPFLLVFILGLVAIGRLAWIFVAELIKPSGPEFIDYVADDFDRRFGDVIWRWRWAGPVVFDDTMRPSSPAPFCPKCWSIMHADERIGRPDGYNEMMRRILLRCDRCSHATDATTRDDDIDDLLRREIAWRLDTGQWRKVVERIGPLLPKG